MTKRDVLQAVSFGERVAEDEIENLAKYFVETDQWRRIYAGDVDIVFGPKGSGKSAIYSLLLARVDPLFDQGTFVVAAENPRGAPAFKDLVADPPTSETEFTSLWKVYFLSLVGDVLRDYEASSPRAKQVIDALEEAGLLPRDKNLRGRLRSVLDYVRSRLKVESMEGGLDLDPATGLPSGVRGKITLREPSAKDGTRGFVSADSLMAAANEALAQLGCKVWILLDRLDVAFAETEELEQNALRALFRVYLDLLGVARIDLKIFLRSDIWRSLTSSGFREASHITRHVNIEWDNQSLLNLVARRGLQNESVYTMYGLDPLQILASAEEQRRFFYKMFPAQVDVGRNKPKTFEWMLGRTKDGTGRTAPRELIHLLNRSREVQLIMLEVGEAEPEGELLFSRSSLKAALPEVSRTRLEQTVFMEYPRHRAALERLEGQKTKHTSGTLAKIWGISIEDAERQASELAEIGFFERRELKGSREFWVPFLYRDALGMIQGTAE